VQIFATTRDAKEFIVGRIVAEARRERIPLSDVEEKIMYFSETAWTLPNMMEVSDAFDRDYDQVEYEEKIGSLVRNFRTNARNNNQNELDDWERAVTAIKNEDHYLLVLISDTKRPADASSGRFFRLVAIAFAITCVILTILGLWISHK
jgi:hypothetical protein